jgi:hypothetical protein
MRNMSIENLGTLVSVPVTLEDCYNQEYPTRK